MKLKGLALGVAMGIAFYTVTPVIGNTFLTENQVVVEALDDFEDEGEDEGEDTSSSDYGSVGSALGEIGKENSLSDEELTNANAVLKPITSLIGSAVGIVVALVSSLIFLITALDLMYICVPFSRNLLFVDGQSGSSMRGGYGMGMGMGGMGMQQAPATHERRQFVSDEAVQCAAMMGNNQQQGMANMGYPGGGMGAMQSQPQNTPVKNVLMVYFKKRMFFMILFAICVVMLTSSIFLGTGINLAGWLMKLVEMLNNSIPK